MARVDPATERVVIRLVYDGPAWAGKTTTLKSLAKSLGSSVISGEEADGRTLQFDWVDYVGGLFRGMPIHCQIVGVPGQRVLERRRLAILEGADAVVFVADSRAAQRHENARSFAGLRRALARRDPPVAAVVQANKRDLAEALPLDEIRGLLGAGDAIAMTESVADSGEGVRETFVLAVRLALDRVRALWDEEKLPREADAADGAHRLLESFELAAPPPAPAIVAHDIPSPPPDATGAPAPAAARSNGARGPRRPDASVPPGSVWPPVHGRVVVHESARADLAIARNDRGDWCGESDQWLVASPVDALFLDLESGRRRLIAWARWHTSAGARISASRAIVLAEAAPGAWRLWQIVRRSRTLRDLVLEALQLDDRLVGDRLLELGELRLRAERQLVDAGWLSRTSLDAIALAEIGEPSHAGLVDYPPPESAELAAGVPSAAARAQEIVEEELLPLLDDALRSAPERLVAVIQGLDPGALAPERRELATLLRSALLKA